ncbi:unnamed protein product [Phaeothamnion confervicola]
MAGSNVTLAPIERVTLNDLAYARLKQALLSGRIEPGTTLTLRQLADVLGTSVMPVREAVTRLSAENALVVVPNRGIIVPPLDAEAADEVWDLRIQLEGHATALAAQRADTEAISKINELCNALRDAMEAGDIHRVLECNSEYQFAIYKSARSPLLLQLIEVLRMKSVPYCAAALRVLVGERPPYYQAALRNHDAIAAAIAAGDAELAQSVKQADLREFRTFVNSVNGGQL